MCRLGVSAEDGCARTKFADLHGDERNGAAGVSSDCLDEQSVVSNNRQDAENTSWLLDSLIPARPAVDYGSFYSACSLRKCRKRQQLRLCPVAWRERDKRHSVCTVCRLDYIRQSGERMGSSTTLAAEFAGIQWDHAVAASIHANSAMGPFLRPATWAMHRWRTRAKGCTMGC